MKKIYLLKVVQNHHERYIGCADARTLVKMAKKAELNTAQEAQRPIEPKRLEELSSFVQEDGTLSTSLVIGTVDSRIKVSPVDEPGMKGLIYYTEFPETDIEYSKMEDTFDVMDGQHRLFSFLPEYCKLPDDVKYDLSFEMYLQPTIREKRLIFKNTNEKQKSVAPNLLMWFRFQLGMLSEKEKEYYNVVKMLNEESFSPLQGRIIMSAEHITGGIKSEPLIALLNKAKLKQTINTPNLDDEKLFRVISIYLKGWELAVDSKLDDRDRELGAFSKIAGLRYMLNLLPTYFDIACENHENFTENFVKQKVEEFFAETMAITPREFFDKDSEYNKDLKSNPFSSATATLDLVEQHRSLLRNMRADNFDPLA